MGGFKPFSRFYLIFKMRMKDENYLLLSFGDVREVAIAIVMKKREESSSALWFMCASVCGFL